MGIGILCMLGVFALWSVIPVLVKLLFPVFDPFTIAFLRLLQGAAVVSIAFFRARPYPAGYSMVLVACDRRAGHKPELLALCVVAELYHGQRWLVGRPGAIRRADGAGRRRVARAVGGRENSGYGAGASRSRGGRRGARGCGPPVRTALCTGQCADAVLGAGLGDIRARQQGTCAAGGDRGDTNPNDDDGCGGHGRTRRDPFPTALGADGGHVDCGARAGRVGHWLCVCFGLGGHEAVQCRAGSVPLTATTPIGQIALAHWVLGEPVTWSLTGGGILILAGVLGMVYAERFQARQRARGYLSR